MTIVKQTTAAVVFVVAVAATLHTALTDCMQLVNVTAATVDALAVVVAIVCVRRISW